MDVLAFGSANVDFICYVNRLPKSGETLHGNKFETGFGGKGANQCVAAAKLGAKTAMISKVGSDNWGIDFIQHFRHQNVNVDYVEQIPEQTTGIAQINVAENGANQIVIVNGANDFLSSDDVDLAYDLFQTSKVLVCQLESPLLATIAAVRTFKGISIVNAAPALENTPKELLTLSSIFCINESEAALMINQDVNTIEEAEIAISRLIEMGGNTIIITLGEKGAIFSEKSKRRTYHLRATKVDNVVDTTGAGDAFIGALAYFIAQYSEVELKQQIGAACEIASMSVQFRGTQCSFPSDKDINPDDLIHKNYDCIECGS